MRCCNAGKINKNVYYAMFLKSSLLRFLSGKLKIIIKSTEKIVINILIFHLLQKIKIKNYLVKCTFQNVCHIVVNTQEILTNIILICNAMIDLYMYTNANEVFHLGMLCYICGEEGSAMFIISQAYLSLLLFIT